MGGITEYRIIDLVAGTLQIHDRIGLLRRKKEENPGLRILYAIPEVGNLLPWVVTRLKSYRMPDAK